jgi:cob(I)alamin adenosyltransferase
VKIYTKRGDAGETSLFDGAGVSKASPRVAAYGDVDEINAFLGPARNALAAEPALREVDELLERVQRDLFSLGALLADPRRDPGSGHPAWTKQVSLAPERIEDLERCIDRWDAEMPALTNFILPGGSAAASALHVARTVTRRAERSVVSLVEQGAGDPIAVVYLNRLSDLLFVAARLANHRLGVPDVIWRS